MTKSTAVILGAGLAGLASAVRLAEGGRIRPLLLERDSRPGGLAQTLHLKGFSTDLGPHRIYTELPEVQSFIERVAGPSLLSVTRTSHIYLRGRFLRYPPAPLDIASRLGLWRMAGFMGSYAAGRLRPHPKVETYESLMRRAFGRSLYDFLIRPYSAKTWKIDPAELHADTARVRISAGNLMRMMGHILRREAPGHETSLRKFLYARGGAETLVRHLWELAQAGGAELRLNCPVHRLELDEANSVRAARILAEDLPGGQPGKEEAPIPGDLFLSTLPLPILLQQILPDRPCLAAAREASSGLLYLNMIFVCLIVRRPSITRDSWLYFPEPHLIFNRAYEAKNFDPSMAAPDRSIFCLEITMRPQDPIGRESNESIIRTVTSQIASTGLFREDEVEEAFVHRLLYAYPLYTLDYAERLERALAGLRQVANLVTLGRQGLFNHNNMDHSIYMGLCAADLFNAASPAEAARKWYDGLQRFKKLRIVD